MRFRRPAEDVDRDAVDISGGADAVKALFGRQKVGDAAGREVRNAGLLKVAFLAGIDVARTAWPGVFGLLVLAFEDADDAPGAVIVDPAARARREDDGDDEEGAIAGCMEQVATSAVAVAR